MNRALSLALIMLLANWVTLWAKPTAKGLNPDQYTSDFMIGDVVVAVIFPESNGVVDPNIENWSEDRKSQALSKIMSGLDWWTQQNSRSPLSFTFVTHTIETKYEPITRAYYDEALWIPDTLSQLGYNGSRFTASRKYINDLRTAYNADWGFIIFVLDSLVDSNGKLADGYFAYAYLGGPYMVMTYDNNGYGIGNMDVVAAHEMGHIFHALDEYAGGSSPYAYSYGYFPTINGNHVYSPTANEPSSIMRGGIRWGLSQWSREMIGWRDQNNNGMDDILDIPPTVEITGQASDLESFEVGFNGSANVNIYPRQDNANGFGLTLDTIDRIEYKLKSSEEWSEALASDGTFDEAEETFQLVFTVPSGLEASAISSNDIEIRAITTYAAFSDASGGGASGGGFGASSSLDLAHPFPNPFKPNSNLGHNLITFTGITPGSKVQIFTAVGQPVYEKTSTTTSLTWDTKNSDGENVGSGVYYYLISNAQGDTKKGKLAVLR